MTAHHSARIVAHKRFPVINLEPTAEGTLVALSGPVSPENSVQRRTGGNVYQKPKLERYGKFRELTLWGFSAPDCDGGSVYGVGGHQKGCVVVQETIQGGGEGGGS